MRIADILLEDFDFLIANTRKTLERLPEHLENYAPHEKSMKLGKLAMHCATMTLFGSYIIEDDDMDLAAPKRPHVDLVFVSAAACVYALDENAAKCRAAIAAASDEHLSKLWKFSYGPHLITNETRSKTFRMMCMDHLVHHTAQLGVYLRLNDIAVPSTYGPSADESM